MSTIDKIIILLKKQNKKQKELTDYLGITKNSFTDWKSGRIKSYQKHLPKIAEFLGVSIDYLLNDTEEFENSLNIMLSIKEKELISRYRNKPEMQSAIDRLLGLDEFDTQPRIYTGQIAALGGDAREVELDADKLAKINELTNEPQKNEE